MSKQLSATEIQSRLDSVLPHLQRVDLAPSYGDLGDRAMRGERVDDRVFDRLLEEEITRQYKAGDQWGNVYIVSAPAWTTYQMVQRAHPIRRLSRKYDPARDEKFGAAAEVAQALQPRI